MLRQSLFAGALAGVFAATPLAAQGGGAPSFGITPYAGYMKFGSLADGPLGTSLRHAAAPVYGAELSLGLTRGLALVGNVAYTQPGLEVGAPIVGGLSVAESSVLMYDAGLRLGVPLAGALPIRPFVQAGAGAMRQSIRLDPVSSHATNFAYHLGAGADVRLAPGFGLQLMVKDYIGRFDAQEATAIDLDTRTSHNWAVSAGVRLGL